MRDEVLSGGAVEAVVACDSSPVTPAVARVQDAVALFRDVALGGSLRGHLLGWGHVVE
ncbi:hypothetical protein PI125_g4461 [Phytophthora idaei]|nr:hypothetical protein PI125_g4461 [Phytophthora idaei]